MTNKEDSDQNKSLREMRTGVSNSSQDKNSYSETEDESGREIINLPEKAKDGLYAKLIVPTQSEGATFTQKGTQSGWSVGGDFVRLTSSKTSSKGEIEENPYEKYVVKFTILNEYVELGLSYDSAVSHRSDVDQTMRIRLSNITDIRQQSIENNPGFVFETQGDVYQVKFGRKGFASAAEGADATTVVNELKNAVKNASAASDSQSSQETEKDQTEADAVDRLSQIKELHDEGVLTDEEFQNKKEELLDQI